MFLTPAYQMKANPCGIRNCGKFPCMGWSVDHTLCAHVGLLATRQSSKLRSKTTTCRLKLTFISSLKTDSVYICIHHRYKYINHRISLLKGHAFVNLKSKFTVLYIKLFTLVSHIQYALPSVHVPHQGTLTGGHVYIIHVVSIEQPLNSNLSVEILVRLAILCLTLCCSKIKQLPSTLNS